MPLDLWKPTFLSLLRRFSCQRDLFWVFTDTDHAPREAPGRQSTSTTTSRSLSLTPILSRETPISNLRSHHQCNERVKYNSLMTGREGEKGKSKESRQEKGGTTKSIHCCCHYFLHLLTIITNDCCRQKSGRLQKRESDITTT